MPERVVQKVQTVAPIAKVDGAKRLVYGVVLEPYVVDAQGEWESPETIEKAAHEFVAHYNDATEIGLQHKYFGDLGLELVESYIAPQDLDFDGELDPDDVIRKGSWVMCVHVTEDALWQQVETGGITGFSIGGVASVATSEGP